MTLPLTTKQRKVNRERKRLASLFSDIDPNKREFVAEQIKNLAWYTVSIKDLQERIDEYGTMIRYDNGGGQSGFKENPDCKTLISYQKHMTDIEKQLQDLVPATKEKSRLSMLMEAMGDE